MSFIKANWLAPENISAIISTRQKGFSDKEYASNNQALHVGEHSDSVQKNRNRLISELGIAREPVWLNQVHSNHCVVVENEATRTADAAITRSFDYPLAIMTADCLPVLLCDKNGTEIAAIHCGWRGLASGIIENTLEKMNNKASTLLAWIGPGICKDCFEVGDDVYQIITDRYSYARPIFAGDGTKKLADLAKLAELILNDYGIQAVYQSGLCTYELHQQFYSYRRQAHTGRMATLIWFNKR